MKNIISEHVLENGWRCRVLSPDHVGESAVSVARDERIVFVRDTGHELVNLNIARYWAKLAEKAPGGERPC